MAMRNKDERVLREIGKRLTAARQVAGYEDAAAAAHDIGMEAQRYRKYERGDAMMPPQLLKTTCDLFDITADFLLFGKPARPRPRTTE